MARGQDTRNHPDRQVSRGAYARLARELSKGFPQMSEDDAPAGGIPRPAMHSCGSCGEMTSTEHGVCADCR